MTIQNYTTRPAAIADKDAGTLDYWIDSGDSTVADTVGSTLTEAGKTTKAIYGFGARGFDLRPPLANAPKAAVTFAQHTPHTFTQVQFPTFPECPTDEAEWLAAFTAVNAKAGDHGEYTTPRGIKWSAELFAGGKVVIEGYGSKGPEYTAPNLTTAETREGFRWVFLQGGRRQWFENEPGFGRTEYATDVDAIENIVYSIVNVIDLGAGGADPTVNHTIIQQAIDDAEMPFATSQDNASVVYLGNKPIVLDKPLMRKSGVRLVGDRGCVLENVATSFNDTFVLLDGLIHEAYWQYQTFYEAQPWVKGQTTITMVTAAEAANLAPNQPVYIFRGFPGNVTNNALYAEIVRVIDINAGTGEISLDASTSHRVDERLDPLLFDYAAGTTYAEGEIVWHAATNRHYASLVAGNTGNEPAGLTDAFWQIETIALCPGNGPTNVAGLSCYICDGGGVEGIGIKSMTAAGQWQGRSASFESYYRDIYVHRSPTLFGGNAFNRCTFENIRGHFYEGVCEFAEGANNTTVNDIKGSFVPEVSPPKDQLITASAPGIILDKIIVDGGEHVWPQLVRIGSGAGLPESVLKNSKITAIASTKVIELRKGNGNVCDTEFIGNGSPCTALLFTGFPVDCNDIHRNKFVDYDYQVAILRTSGTNARFDNLDFDANKILGTISSSDFAMQGANGKLTNNFIEDLSRTENIKFDTTTELNTWTIHGNTSGTGVRRWDDQALVASGNITMRWYHKKMYVSGTGAGAITLPPTKDMPESEMYTVINMDDAPTHVATVEDPANDRMRVLGGGGGQYVTAVNILPLQSLQFVRYPGTRDLYVI